VCIVTEETRKANRRRVRDPLFERVFRGRGIDIGHGGDRLDRDDLFPGVQSCDGFDIEDGDAQNILQYLPATSYDFVYSSHCLEHLPDPLCALRNWFGLVRPMGFLVFVVPDEDLYEQGNWPSRFNAGHLWTFTFAKRWSWSPRSINVIDALLDNLSGFSFVRITLVDDEYDYAIVGTDQSFGPAEVGIEVILQKHG
jgi:SAM-dependent methyltransferase